MLQLFVPASFVFGLILGSFANVVILRWGTGRTLSGRSGCPACGHTLSWFELIPVISFLVQKGRCRECGSKISPQYILVELVFGVVFALCAHVALTMIVGGAMYVFLLYAWTSAFLLIAIAVYDIRHFIIPDGLVYTYIILSFVWGVFSRGMTLSGALQVFSSGLLIALPLFLLWALSRGRWMGFGDIKLALGMGFMLGTLGGASALIFGVWLGAAISLLVLAYKKITPYLFRFASRGKRFTMKSEIPFGPFLVAGTFFVFLTGITLTSVVPMM
jgi:prepilin signal peptidase PulO-like enzyme (type II secretory pathway)